jgi:lipid-A-disaccharide synthase
LPFEKSWYEQRGVRAHYVGHPFFDELTEQHLDGAFLDEQRARGGPIVGLLPGSRTQEVTRNFPTFLRAGQLIHQTRPDARFLVACFKEEHGQIISSMLRGNELSVEVCVGRTPEIMSLAHSCIAVSGSVGLELLYHRKPSVVIYRIGKLDLKVCKLFLTSPYISLVNLLAEKELFPEFLTDRCEAQAAAGHVLGWLNDPAGYAARQGELDGLCRRVARPGACERTTEYVLEVLGRSSGHRLGRVA